MKNLKLLYSSAVKNELIEDASTFCINSDSGIIYFTNGKVLHCLEPETKEITSISLNLDLSHDESEVLEMHYLLETQSLCLVFLKGDIVVYNLLDEKDECVGCVDFGIRAAAWSPDQELFVLLTGADTFILMTKDFYPLVEKTLHQEEFGESSPITVGWGSKETQFHGSEGKGAAKIKPVEPKPVVPWDDGKPRISWRGDGDYFVTSVVDGKQGCRKLRIWNREGILQCTSEVKDGLEHPLSWSPSGSSIACTQQHPNKHEVIFFEKNGLQHGQFTLPYPPKSFMVKEILWNIDSSILLLWGHEMNNTSKFSVLLWTVNNYHWYLKQTLHFEYDSVIVIKQVTWDSHHPYRLHIFCSNGQYFQYTWAWAIYHSLGTTNDDHVSTVVIDNDNALVTPLKKMIVPPPMCSYLISCGTNINNVVFAPCPKSEDFCLILSNEEVVFFSKVAPSVTVPPPDKYKIILQAAGGNGFKSMVNPHFCLGSYSVDWESTPFLLQYPLSLCHWTWITDRKLLCVGSDDSSSSSILLSIEVPSCIGSSDTTVLKGSFCAKADEKILGISSNEDGTVVAVQLVSGKILKFEHGQLSPWLYHERNLCLPSPCSQFSLCTVNNQVLVLALSDRFCLYCNDMTLLSKCTSYCYNGDFLLVTTCDNNLKCYSMSNIWEIANGNSHVNLGELSSQQCERGARILTSVPGDTKLILQIPRGNLEVIHPRPLVVSTICKFLNKNQYKKAFDISKVHRINLNVLYDYNPQKFLSSVDTFVEQIESPSDLNIFLVSLVNENVSKAYFFQKTFECANDVNFSSKCDLVCDAVRKVVETKNVERYFETLIATYSQKTNSELDKALFKIKEMKDAVKEQNNLGAIADKAMKFLLFLVDVDKLYKVALGTYDFELAVMVAEKSNMDPKEYLPFLNSLQEMEDNYRKYKIDMHLQRYKNALQNICKCEDRFEECLELIRNQRLYTAALYLFPPSSNNFKAVWNEYGDYLMGKMYYKEAGLAYWKSENHEKFLKASQESGDWQLALCAAHNLQYSRNKMVLLCHNLAMKLKECQRYEESALLLEQYAQEIEQSISTLIEGQLWDSALHSIVKHSRFDMAKSHLRPALEDHYQHLLTTLCQMETDFCRYSDRLKVVREKKDNWASEMKQDGSSDTTDDDLFSETSSIASAPSSSQVSKQFSGSLITRKSSRSKRKLELKKYRLKEGSANEDLALITELSEIITKVDKMRDNFFSFLRILVQSDLENEAKEIQQKMKQMVAKIETNIPKIWNTVKPSMDMNFGPDFTTNAIVDVIEAQKKTIRNLSDPALAPPKWMTKDIYLQLLD